MKYLKLFENFEQPDGTGLDTFWETKVDGETVRVTIKDVMDYIDNGVEIDTNELKHLLIDVERDPVRVENADLKYPIILAKYNGDFVSILDGQHRVVKAIRDDVKVRAKILDLDLATDTWKKIFIP